MAEVEKFTSDVIKIAEDIGKEMDLYVEQVLKVDPRLDSQSVRTAYIIFKMANLQDQINNLNKKQDETLMWTTPLI